MKTDKLLKLLTLALCALAFAFVTGCEGPEGKQGPKGDTGDTGATGAQGEKGDDGTPGVAGNVTCLDCHSVDNPQSKQEEFSRSVHSAGAIAVDYAGGRSSCAECHSHEGFLEWDRTGTVAENIASPGAWQCKTCHNIHTTFEKEDYALRADDAVTLASGGMVDAGNNNLCANCHKARRASTYYDDPATATDATKVRKFTDPDDIAQYTTAAVGPAGSIVLDQSGTTDTLVVTFDVPAATHAYISSTHAGPHHGPQADIWSGVGGVTEGVEYDAHSDGCVKCHMGPATGHSFQPKSDNCTVTDCHSSDKDDALDAFEARIMAVGLALDAEHAVHYDDAFYQEEGTAFGSFHPVYASLERDIFNAWWNFQIILEDRSKSAHNPTYMDALLDDAEAALGIQ